MKPFLLFHPKFWWFSFHRWFTGTVGVCHFADRGSALLCAFPVLVSSIRTARGGVTTRRQRMRTEQRSEAAEEKTRPLETMQDIATIDIGILWSQLITHLSYCTYYIRATCCISMKWYEYRRDGLGIITGSYRWVLASAILSTHTHTPLGMLYAHISTCM